MSLGRYKALGEGPRRRAGREPPLRPLCVYGFGLGFRLPPISPIIGLGLMGCGSGGFGATVDFGFAMTTG
jgi:hypothetical protein